jgi:hypothetical protein
MERGRLQYSPEFTAGTCETPPIYSERFFTTGVSRGYVILAFRVLRRDVSTESRMFWA